MLKRVWLIATVAASTLTGPALAWNGTGHKQVADIAWPRLTNLTKNRISAILMKAGDAPFKQIGNSSAARRDAFRRAATFPDFIKFNSSSYNSMIPMMNDLWHPDTDPLVSPSEKVKCKSWHYYDTPIRFSGTMPGVAQSNADKALNRAILRLTALKTQTSPSARKEQFWWLSWIEHLTSDLHQPLHCCSSYQFSSTGDNGGNDFLINHSSHKLHSYWDAGIDRASGLTTASPPASFFQSMTSSWSSSPGLQPPAAVVADLTPANWISKGATLADTVVYTGITPNSAPSSAYNAAQVALCKKQAVLGGYRLARLLNTILG